MIMTDVLHNCQLRQHQRPNYYQPHLVDDIDAMVHSEGELIELVDRLDRTSTTFGMLETDPGSRNVLS